MPPQYRDWSVGFDVCKPRNPNIPFFPTALAYSQRLVPDLPAGSDPKRDQVWLVQPGIQSIEVYEAIITKSLGSCQPLQKYICQCGVIQIFRSRSPRVPTSAADDYGAREERDICFTLVSRSEKLQLVQWMEKHDVEVFICPKIATPLGEAYLASWDLPSQVQALEDACKELGFGTDPSDYPRSALPPGVIPLSSMDVWEWSLPGVDEIARDGRAVDDCGIKRIEW